MQIPKSGPTLDKATRAQLAEHAAARGYDLLPGQAVESGLPGQSNALQSLQAIVEMSVVGGKKLRQHLETQRSNFADILKNEAAASWEDFRRSQNSLMGGANLLRPRLEYYNMELLKAG